MAKDYLGGVCVVQHHSMKILIMDAPTDANLTAYLEELKDHGVTDLVRLCEPSYSADEVEKSGIQTHEMTFADGAAPPEDLLQKWVELISSRYASKHAAQAGVVAVHCVAGLGRAPLMAAIALIEIAALHPMDAVETIRSRQKGAINAKQLKFLQSYKRTLQRSGGQCNCTIS
eukprot:TRINITY_DN38836_c0_g1_i1.p1 TRINITY_DN38836_c0_g1~~TRINITY_DN38836_c0_g1_i1.p1  ORF type:complete len:173 (-),score=43.93 TRINITY_DN38836_c0_g1_i1:176-694(-)